MTPNPEGNSEWQLRWEEEQRKEYQQNPAMWLNKRYGWLRELIEERSERQISEAKTLVENALELSETGLVSTRETTIMFIAIIAAIALAAAGLWFGVAGVALVAVIRSSIMWSAHKDGFRLDRFRDRFRELLKRAHGGVAEMLAEDKAFLQKYEDSILYALVVPPHKRKRPDAGDLEHIETLYREYCYSLDHHHLEGSWWRHDLFSEWEKNHLKDCKFCHAARRVREHIEGAISRFEGEIAKWRLVIVTQIDGNNPEGAILAKEFLKDLPMRWPGSAAGTELYTLVEWLRDKDRWTFDHADKVRDACRADESVKGALNMRETIPGYEPGDALWKVYDKLSRAMEEATAAAGLRDAWKHYSELKRALADKYLSMEETFRSIRQIMKRRNPEVMIRELAENRHSLVYSTYGGLTSLGNYGYDRELVLREVTAAQKFLAREGGKWDKCYAKELAAAKSFAWLEERLNEMRWKEAAS